MPLVFYLDADTHQISLEMPGLIDRTFGFGRALFYHEHGLVRPLSSLQEFGVRPLRHEHIGKHHVVGTHRAVVHAQARGEINPFPVALRPKKMVVSAVLGLAGTLRSSRLEKS